MTNLSRKQDFCYDYRNNETMCERWTVVYDKNSWASLRCIKSQICPNVCTHGTMAANNPRRMSFVVFRTLSIVEFCDTRNGSFLRFCIVILFSGRDEQSKRIVACLFVGDNHPYSRGKCLYSGFTDCCTLQLLHFVWSFAPG